MVQLHILSGKKSGTRFLPARLPMTAGRSNADLCLDENGVWDRHFLIAADSVQGIFIRAEKDALIRVNDQSVLHTVLHSGDIISLGSVRLRFDLSPVRQTTLALSETLTWVGFALLFLMQIALILQLVKR